MENNTSILDKVNFLIKKSISKQCNSSELEKIISYTELHSDDLLLGKVFGYSVSDYAFATLKWIGSEKTLKAFEKTTQGLDESRLSVINDLIDKESYRQY